MKIEVLKALFENHRTSETALSRRQITIEFMTNDRSARKIIEDARNAGCPIVSSSRAKGYWWNKKDYEEIYLREEKARLVAGRRKIDAYYSDDPDQITIEEVI